MDKATVVSLVIPVYNEADSLAELHREIREVAADILNRPKALAVVGPFGDPAPFQL